MYVDDDDDLRGLWALALGEENDMELVLCESGEKALEKLSMLQADLILLDVMMRGLDGPKPCTDFDNCQATKNAGGLYNGQVQANDIAQYQALGATGTIMKNLMMS